MTDPKKELCGTCHGPGCPNCGWSGYVTVLVQKENEIFDAASFAYNVLVGKTCLYCDGTGVMVNPDNPNETRDCPRGCKPPRENPRLPR